MAKICAGACVCWYMYVLVYAQQASELDSTLCELVHASFILINLLANVLVHIPPVLRENSTFTHHKSAPGHTVGMAC